MGYLKHYFTYVEGDQFSSIIEHGLPADKRLYTPDELTERVTYRDTLTNKLKIKRGIVCLRLRITEDDIYEKDGKLHLKQATNSFMQFSPLGLRYDSVSANGAYQLDCVIWHTLRDHGATHFELQVVQTSPDESVVIVVANGIEYEIQTHYGEVRVDLLRDYLAEAQQIVAKIPFLTVSAKEE